MQEDFWRVSNETEKRNGSENFFQGSEIRHYLIYIGDRAASASQVRKKERMILKSIRACHLENGDQPSLGIFKNPRFPIQHFRIELFFRDHREILNFERKCTAFYSIWDVCDELQCIVMLSSQSRFLIIIVKDLYK